MNNKTIRLLHLLDSRIEKCMECPLHTNGRIQPYWNVKSSYVLIGDVEHNKLLWELMEKHGFSKEQFLIINSLNCILKDQNPSYVDICKKWVDLYINAVVPLRGMMFGKYLNENGMLEMRRVNNFNMPFIPMIKSVTPKFASLSIEGTKLLEDSIIKFKLM